jgi:hypothetical protein
MTVQSGISLDPPFPPAGTGGIFPYGSIIPEDGEKRDGKAEKDNQNT